MVSSASRFGYVTFASVQWFCQFQWSAISKSVGSRSRFEMEGAVQKLPGEWSRRPSLCGQCWGCWCSCWWCMSYCCLEHTRIHHDQNSFGNEQRWSSVCFFSFSFFQYIFLNTFFLYADEKSIIHSSPPFIPVYLSACSFSLTVKLMWTKFGGKVSLDQRTLQFYSYPRISLLAEAIEPVTFVILLATSVISLLYQVSRSDSRLRLSSFLVTNLLVVGKIFVLLHIFLFLGSILESNCCEAHCLQNVAPKNPWCTSLPWPPFILQINPPMGKEISVDPCLLFQWGNWWNMPRHREFL